MRSANATDGDSLSRTKTGAWTLCVPRARTAVGLQQLGGEWLKRLPNPDDLIHDREEASAAYEKGVSVLARGDLDALLKQVLITPAELTEIVGLIGDSGALDLAPSWLWQLGDVDANTDVPASLEDRARRLADPRRRTAFLRFAEADSRYPPRRSLRCARSQGAGGKRPLRDHPDPLRSSSARGAAPSLSRLTRARRIHRRRRLAK